MLPLTSGTLLESVASSIIKYYAAVMYDAQIICESTCVSDEFLKTIPVPFQLSKPILHEKSFLFVLPQTKSFIKRVLNGTVNFTKSKYIVLIDGGNCTTVAWILEQCWHRKLLNVVVIPLQNNSSPIYTYFPFREGFCFDPSPFQIASFTNTSVFNIELFPERKVWNLQNCTLKVSSFNFNPGIYFDGTGMHGHYSPVFRAVADAMNFSYEFLITDGWFGGASGPNKTGVRGDVYTGRAHLGFTFFIPADLNYLDYDALAMTGCLTWCVPGTFRNKSVWWLIVGEFTPEVWLLLFISAASIKLATIILAHWLNQVDGHNSDAVVYMNIWAALLQTPGNITQYKSISLRLVWVGWLVSSVVLSTLYLGAQKSLRTTRHSERSVKNLEELAETGFQAWYAGNLGKIVCESALTSPAVARMWSNSRTFPPDQYGALFKLLRFGNITALLSDKVCRSLAEAYVTELELYPIPNACMHTSQINFFAMAKKSVFTETISIVMGRLTQAGLIQKSFAENKQASGADIKHTPITLRDMLPMNLLLGFGLLTSFLTLLVEKLSVRCKLKKIRLNK